MKLNLIVRVRNKAFWCFMIPMVIVLIQQIAKLFGFELHLEGIGNQLVAIVETIFLILGGIGVVVDPTTEGLQDSNLAMTYEVPKPKE